MDDKMSNLYNATNIAWFPVMPNYSKQDGRDHPDRKRFRLQYGHVTRYLSPEKLAEHAGVSIKTAYKWISGRQRMDDRTRQLLHVKALGLLPDPRWQRWHLDEAGRLTAPNGWSFFPDELLSLSIIKQLNGELQAQVARLTVENRQLREAIDYLQANRLPANVIPFPDSHFFETKKKPG